MRNAILTGLFIATLALVSLAQPKEATENLKIDAKSSSSTTLASRPPELDSMRSKFVARFGEDCESGFNCGRTLFIEIVSGQQDTYQLWSMNIDGSDRVLLLTFGPRSTNYRTGELTFTRDSRKLLFTVNDQDSNFFSFFDIFKVNVDGTGLVNLTNNDCKNFAPSFSPDESQIVFLQNCGPNEDDTKVFVMNSDGTNQHRLTTHPIANDDNTGNRDSSPSFSPDGTKIVFSSAGSARPVREIFVSSLDGIDVRKLANWEDHGAYNFSPKYLPDGKIVFLSNRDNSPDDEIYIMTGDGQNHVRLTNMPGLKTIDVSPDGRRVAWTNQLDGSFHRTQLFVMELNGNNFATLYNNAAGEVSNVRFSPDSTKIGFEVSPLPYGSGFIYSNVVNVDGSGHQTYSDATRDVPFRSFGRPDIDGDGVLVLTDNCPTTYNPDQIDTDGDASGNACDADDDNDGVADESDNCPLTANQYRFAFSTAAFSPANPEIYTQNLDGSGVTRLTDNSQNDLEPSFNRSGTQIVWTSNRSNSRFEIYKMNANGSGTVRLTNVAGGNFAPVFSPDGTKIAFESRRTGERNIFIMNADGSNQTQLTSLTQVSNSAQSPSFNQDGSRIVFDGQRGVIFNATWDIYSIRSDGTDEVRLTTAAGIDRSASYSPDGSKIVFISERDQAGNGEIYIMNADGSNQTRLTNNADYEQNPTFTPDGSRIMFAVDGNLMIMDADGQNAAVVTTDNLSSHPSFAPQADTDGDGVGDVCDNCAVPNQNQTDSDNDGVGDTCDNCSTVANPNQANNDGDALGDACDPDDDNDGVLDLADNCPLTANANQADNDGDSTGDVCDPDDDNDGVLDATDNCRFTQNPNQADNDHDNFGDACDPDDDNDGVPDTADNCAFTANPNQADNDQDNIGDTCDPDDDNDGVLDGADNCALTSNPDQADGDDDGTGDTCDPSFDVSTLGGSDVLVEGPGATVTFAEVLVGGTTSFVAIDVSQNQLPTGFSLCPECEAFEITTDADYIPPIDVCLTVPVGFTEFQFQALRLMHGEEGVFVDRTTDRFTNDDGSRFVCGRVDSLSPFTLAAQFSPTAALVSVSGRVLSADGQAIRNAVVTLSDANGNATQTRTNSFGHYGFREVEVGQTIIISVRSKRYRFTPRVVNLSDELTDFDIIALP